MNHPFPSPSRRNRRAFFASLLSYLLLAGQLTPLVLASNNSAARTAPSRAADVARGRANTAPATEAAPAPVRLSPVPVAIAPNITATKVDSYTNSPNPADPGDTITYTVTISNTGPGATDATGVTFTDTIDPNTTFSGTAVSTPIAVNDSFSALGNVRISTANGAANLLANDNDPNTGNTSALTVTVLAGDNSLPFAGTSAQGGQVTSSAADGTFSYNPAPGFTGSDSFSYTISNGNGTDTATVNITVGPTLVWFINNDPGAPAGNDGRITSPFNSIASYNASAPTKDPNDIIFIYTGAAAYTGGLTLANGMKVIGQGASLQAETGAPPAGSETLPGVGGAPTINNPGANIITLAQNNTLRGFDTGNSGAAGSDIAGTSFGTLTVSALTIGGDGRALNLTTGTLAATIASISASNTGTNAGLTMNAVGGALTVSGTTTITNPGGTGLDMTNSPAGTNHNFGATTVNKGAAGNAGTGVNLSANLGTTTFSSLAVNTSFGIPLNIASGGTVNVTNAAGSSLASAQQTQGLVVSNTAVAMNFTSISVINPHHNSSGTPLRGIDLQSVGGAGIAVGTTSVTNSGPGNPSLEGIFIQNSSAPFSFGNTTLNTLQNTGVRLNNNTGAVTFADLDITPSGGTNTRGLHATTQTGTITSTSGSITTTTGTAVEITGAGTTPLNMVLTLVSVNGAPSGIVLQNTSASPGGFSVIGDNSNARNGSGGVMTNTTDDAIRLTNANNITLKSINLNSPGDTLQVNIADNENTPGEHGVEAIGGSNIILSGILIDSPAGSGMIGLNLTGTNRLNNNSLVTNIDNPATHGLFLRNGSGFNMTLFEVNDTDFTNSSSGASTVNVKNDGTANMTVEVENGCIFEALNSQAVTMDGGGTAGTTGTLTSLVTGNTFRNAVASEPSPGVFITSENNVAALVVNGATHNATISNNTFENIAEDGRVANTSIIRTQNSGGKLTAVVSNNIIQNINYQTGAGGRHVIGHVFEPAAFDGTNFSNLRFEANTATNITYTATNREFIFVDYRQFASGGDVKILSNNWNMPTSAATSEAMELNFIQANAVTVDLQVDNNGQGTGAISNTSTRFLRIDSEESATVNATVTNNIFTNNNGSPGIAIDFQTIDSVAGAPNTPTMCVNVSGNNVTAAGNQIRLNEVVGTMNVTQASSVAVGTANTGASVTVVGTPTFGAPPCTLPSNAPVSMSADATGTDSDAPAQTTVTSSTSTASRMGGGVTSRPFVSMPRQTTTTTTQATTTTTQASRTTGDTIQANPPVVVGDTLTFTIGNLPAGESVTITFAVTIDNPFPAISPSQVSNQGTVTADGGINVQTDDPDVAGSNNPTITPVLAPPDIAVKDASGPEPASGSSTMAFTVVLSPAPATAVSVDFTTADEPAGPGKAVAGVDYTATSGTLNFAAGQTVQTISVPILADANAPEPDETFLVNLTGSVGGVITDSQAVGTITAANPAGAILISELRTFGPGGAGDDFVEVYNNSNSPVTVAASDASAGWSLVRMGAACTDTPVVIGVIPNGTVIPARGHYLFVGSQYSLTNYGGTGAAAGNLTMSSDIGENANVGLFNTSSELNLSTATRLDAVGFGTNVGNNCDLLREGNILPAVNSGAAGLAQHSFYRSLYSFVPGVGPTVPNPGFPADRNDNARDFLFVDTNATNAAGVSQQRLGAPGPENIASPRVNDNVAGALLDGSKTSSQAPNRVRFLSDTGPNKTFGTMSIRRRFTNNTGAPITRLRFRVVEVTTFPRPDGATADVRALSSTSVSVSPVNDSATCAANGVPATAPCTATVQGTTLEEPPTQPNGGGYNSTMSAGTVTLGTPLANGASISVQFLLGVEQTGNFRFLLNVEALP